MLEATPTTTLEISVVVPVYNEQDNVKELIQRISASLHQLTESHEIIIVDDGSRDQTNAKLVEIKREVPELRILELSRNSGQTAALSAGIDHARGFIIITMDGDLQHQPEMIKTFIDKINEGYDVVSGWRKVRTDNYFLRRVLHS